MKIRMFLAAGLLLIPVFLFEGCVTSDWSGEGAVVVCPQCNMVARVAYSQAHPSVSRAGVTTDSIADRGYRPINLHEYTCPGCKGALTGFVSEGKWQHKCSICKQHVFICPVSHPSE